MLQKWRTDWWQPEVGEEVAGKEVKVVCLPDGSVLCVDSVNVGVLSVILYCNFTRCYHWRRPGNKISFYDFLQLYANLQLPKNKL